MHRHPSYSPASERRWSRRPHHPWSPPLQLQLEAQPVGWFPRRPGRGREENPELEGWWLRFPGPARGEHGPSSVHCNATGGSVSEQAAWLLASCRLPASRPVLPSVDPAAEPRAQADTSPFVGRHRAEGFEGNDGICRCGAAWPLLVQCSNILLDPKNYRSYT